MNREPQCWISSWGDFVEIQRNMCGCCPNGYVFTRRHVWDGKVVSAWLTFKNRKHFLKYCLKECGLEKLP